MQIYKYFTPLVKHNIILLIFYFCNTGSINDGCTNAVATAMTPSIDTTTRRSPLIRMKIPIRYIMDRETRRPLVVPDRQMHSFIAVAGAYDEQIVYLDPTIVSLREGDRVRIVGGVFSGVEGIFKEISRFISSNFSRVDRTKTRL